MNYHRLLRILLILILAGSFLSCKPKEQEVMKEQAPAQPAVAQEVVPEPTKEITKIAEGKSGEAQPEPKVAKDKPAASASPLALEVNGKALSKADLQTQINRRFEAVKGNVPAERTQEVKTAMRQQVINEFIARTILTDEVNRLKIAAPVKEVDEAVARFEKSLPQGVTMADVLKKNKITKAKIREDLQLGIRVGKLLDKEAGTAKTPEKEITQFYEKNIDQFNIPESVKARHILLATAQGDEEKIKKEKFGKAEALRKQLIEGGDFAQLAGSNSDCPSKASGGDLGNFQRGQMVKAFEDAAFSQKINEIGPVVETDYGYHVIQVLEKQPAKTMPLDEALKAQIADNIQQESKQKLFSLILDKLRAKANIVIH